MADVLVTFSDPVTSPNGASYVARACGRQMADGRWEGWLEFERTDGSEVLRSARETTQPNRTDTEYWATGLTPVYLEGALGRAIDPLVLTPATAEESPAFEGPLPAGPRSVPRTESVLNPFSVYRKGEALLRRQLGALAGWHLVNIIEAYELSDLSEARLNRMSAEALIELIVAAVRSDTREHALDS